MVRRNGKLWYVDRWDENLQAYVLVRGSSHTSQAGAMRFAEQLTNPNH